MAVVPVRGFTLFELLVVMLLIGITISFVSLNVQRDEGRIAGQEARRLAALLNHMREETVLLGKTIAVRVDSQDRSYSFLQADEGWQLITADDVLRVRRLPETLTVSVEILEAFEGAEDLIIADAGGDLTPFTVAITGGSRTHYVTLDDTQNVTVATEAPEAN